jgi:hypothetical protein
VPTKRSAFAFARGARAGVLMTSMSVAVKTVSKAAVNLLSRSWMRSRKPGQLVSGQADRLSGMDERKVRR